MRLRRAFSHSSRANEAMTRSYVLLALALAACGSAPVQCPDFNPERNPYVGDLHVHTSYSFDAVLFGVTAGPRDAYEFARAPPYRCHRSTSDARRSCAVRSTSRP